MSVFTAVTDGFAPQLFMAEIVDAVNERRLASIASGATGLPGAIPATAASAQSFQGGDVKPVHLLIQELLEALAPQYVNHGASVPVETLYTLATWRAAAGINSSGFKRATAWANPAADPTFSYGLIQTGDIAGYWIWVEIVLGLSALQWTRKEADPSETQTRLATGATDPNINIAAGFGDTAWAATSWGTITTAAPYRTCSVAYDLPGGGYRFYVFGRRSKMSVAFSEDTPVACDCEFFLQALALQPPDVRGYYDFDGWIASDWTSMETVSVVASSASATMAGYTIDSTATNHAVASGVAAFGNAKWSIGGSTCWGLLKWTFTRTS